MFSRLSHVDWRRVAKYVLVTILVIAVANTAFTLYNKGMEVALAILDRQKEVVLENMNAEQDREQRLEDVRLDLQVAAIREIAEARATEVQMNGSQNPLFFVGFGGLVIVLFFFAIQRFRSRHSVQG